MIIVRNIFQLKFGKAREAIALGKEGLALIEQYGGSSSRLLTDLVGPSYYTLVVESTYDSLAEFERAGEQLMADEVWRAWYAKFHPLVEEGHREIFTVVA
jgi:hypothetical protein